MPDIHSHGTRTGSRPSRLLAVVGAGRGQYYAGAYSAARGQLKRDGDFAVLTTDELRDRAAVRGVTLCGELDDFLADRHSSPGPSQSAVPSAAPSPVAGVRRAGFLAELGRWLFTSQGAADPALLQPLYLRRAPGLGDEERR